MLRENSNVIAFSKVHRDVQPVNKLIPKRLHEARLANFLNQSELALLVGVSRQSISAYELGEKTPEPETMCAISQALQQPISYFIKEKQQSFGDLSPNFFRKVGADTKRRNLACDVYASWLAQAAYIFDDIANFPSVDIPSFMPENDNSFFENDEIELIAEKVRTHFGLGMGPISNILRLLESKGVVVSRLQLKKNIEAFSFRSGKRPFIFLASEKESAARARFDAAHELGHLVLHRWVNKEQIEDKKRLKIIEKEANNFASAFLLPRKSFTNEIYSSRLDAFVDLKSRWKVSIAAMVYRCKSLNILDDEQATNLYKQISVRKWGKFEPLDGKGGLPLEEPILLKKITEIIIQNNKLSKEDIKNLLSFSPIIIEKLLGLEEGFLTNKDNFIEFEPTLKKM